MNKKIALLGNPNSGKTSVFNKLTGSSQQVGNWPGVTVARKSGNYRKDKSIVIQDLPGVYSLSPYSLEEQITRDYLTQMAPDVLINILDATNLERSLYLTLQLLELGLPMVVGLNMMDLVDKEKRKIDTEKLSYSLGVPVVAMSALKNVGLDEVVKIASQTQDTAEFGYDERLEAALAEISTVASFAASDKSARFKVIKLFEGDALLMEQVNAIQQAEINDIVTTTEKIFDDDRESIIVNERYDLIGQIVRLTVTDGQNRSSQLTDKIDRIVTNKWLGLPIFIFIMWLVYFLAIQTVGTLASDWLNDTFFGSLAPNFLSHLMAQFSIVPWLQDLVLNGIVAGIGAILGFLPQIFVLFLLLGILEDSGYMARVAFVMDRIFRRFGLSGKSFIPMLIASGCGVPGIMATRTIEQERERKITIMITTFMPCSAKLPIIALVSGAFFRGASWVAPSAYFMGMGMIIVSGVILKKARMFSGDTSAFIMELPTYHLPQVRTVFKYGFERAFSFVKRAGTIIFLVNVLIWFLSNYSFALQQVSPAHSMLAAIGSCVAFLFAPLGFGEWRAVVATLTGLLAKETIVGTMGVLYSHGEAGNRLLLWQSLHDNYTALAAYSLLTFNLLCAPCIAAISTIYKEMGSAKWTLRAVGFQTAVAYSMSFIIYQFGLAISTRALNFATFLAVVVLFAGLYFIFRKTKNKEAGYELS